MRGDDVGQPHTVGGVGARHGDEVAHGGVGDETTILHVLLDCLGQCARGSAPRHPADAPIEALCQGVERQAVLLMQRAQQPALLERAVGRIGVQEVSKDERVGLRHLPHDGGHRVTLQPTQTADALVAVHHDVGCARGHDHDGRLLAGVRQRR